MSDLSVNRDMLRRYHELLVEKLARGSDPVLAEMAREVRSGRMTLREAMFSTAYEEKITQLAERAFGAVAGMSREEIEAAAEGDPLEHRIGELEREMAVEPPDPPRPPVRDPDPSRDDEMPDSFLVGAPRAERTARPPQRERWQRRRAGS